MSSASDLLQDHPVKAVDLKKKENRKIKSEGKSDYVLVTKIKQTTQPHNQSKNTTITKNQPNKNHQNNNNNKTTTQPIKKHHHQNTGLDYFKQCCFECLVGGW